MNRSKARAIKDVLEEIYGPSTVGMLIRSSRTANDFTQRDLAKTFGMSVRHLSAIEKDHIDISLQLAIDFAVVLGGSVQTFLLIWIENQIHEAGLEQEFEFELIKVKRKKSQRCSNLMIKNSYVRRSRKHI